MKEPQATKFRFSSLHTEKGSQTFGIYGVRSIIKKIFIRYSVYRWSALLSFIALNWPASATESEHLSFTRVYGQPSHAISADILKVIYHHAGIDISITKMPAARASYESENGHRDGELVRTESYKKNIRNLVQLPTPIGYAEPQIFTKNGKSLNRNNLEEYSIALVRGIKLAEDIARERKCRRLFEVTTASQALNMVRLGHVDATITDKLNGLYLIKSEKIGNVAPDGEPLALVPQFHYIHQKHRHLVPELTKIMLRMERSGEISRMWDDGKKQLLLKLSQLE